MFKSKHAKPSDYPYDFDIRPKGIKNLQRKIYGVGVNDVDYAVYTYESKQYCSYYNTWKHMLTRACSDKFKAKRATYRNCSVQPEWEKLTSFRSWMVQQNWVGKVLDKDLLVPGNKLYSEDTCMFVDTRLNNLLLDSAAIRGDLPQGVTNLKRGTRPYQASIKIMGKRQYIGIFEDPMEAHKAYLKEKVSYGEDLLDIVNPDKTTREAVERHLELWRSKI